MKKELEDTLFEKYPHLFKYFRNDPQKPFYYGIETGDGWYDLLDNTFSRLQEIVDKYPEEEQEKYVLYQVKEKFGTLRIYLSYYDEEMNDVIESAYIASRTICVKCGSRDSVTINAFGFIRSLCKSCMEEYMSDGSTLKIGEL